MTEESPFKPGARVAVQRSHGDSYTEARVEKVYKNGNFTLFGSTQQWHPWKPALNDKDGVWSAHPTGHDSWDRRQLEHWSELNDAKITAAMALSRRAVRREKLVSALEHLEKSTLTDAMLDQIEAALTVPAKEAAE